MTNTTDYPEVKPLKRLESMVGFVSHLRAMTQTELCRTYPKNFKPLEWKGNVHTASTEYLANDAILWRITGEYMKFLLTKLEKKRFVPCDQKGNVLTKPEGYDDWRIEFRKGYVHGYEGAIMLEYMRACDNVYFEGWESHTIMGQTSVTDSDFTINLLTLECYQHVEGGTLDFQLTGNTIDALANVVRGLSITDSAIKKIFG